MSPTITLYRDDLTALVEADTETYHHFLANGWSLHQKVLSVSAEPLPQEDPVTHPVATTAPAKPRAHRKPKTAE